MQVKKFEATTIKEALEMVKNTLGPEAIILNAKDNTGSFGLMGRKSIEVTAAISEQQLLKKQWAEGRLKEEELSKHRSHSARTQKQFIERSVNRYTKNLAEEEKTKRQTTQTRYIDIDDEENGQLRSARGRTVENILNEIGNQKTFVEAVPAQSSQRVKQAVNSALRAFEDSEVYVKKVEPKTAAYGQNLQSTHQQSHQPSLNEVQSLKNEIQQLKELMQNFTKTPVRKTETDFKLHPGAEHGVSFEMSGTYNKLTQSGVSVEIMLELLEVAKNELGPENSRKQALLEGWIAKIMMSQIKIKNPATSSPVQIFLGPSGSGKSSALVKIASEYVLNRHKKVGILTCDTEKVGAVEQLRIYSQILNIPFGILKSKEDWTAIVDSLKTLDVILVDYPGFALKDMDQIEKIRSLLPYDTVPCDKHLVLSSGLQDKDAFEIAERYRVTKPTDVIFTKLDEAVTHGVIYNFQRKFDLPLHSFGVGDQLPEDFEFASKERVVDLIFKITKIRSEHK